jgi:hypothetical protein
MDLGQAEHLVKHATNAGYAMRRDTDRHRPTAAHRVRFLWDGTAEHKPEGWLAGASAVSAIAAMATTLAFLQLTGRIGALEEEPCPTP